MPSDSVSSFLDRAQANRILHPEQIEQIVRQPDVSRMPLAELCHFLEHHRVLTRYQADMLRQGRGEELHFAGYPVLEELGPCPGGTAYQALHPSLRTPVVLRRLRADWFPPSDNAAAYVQRARVTSTLSHPNLLPVLDAGVHRDEAYVVLEPPGRGANLDTLVKEIGPMPAVLAVDFARQAASALRMVHERGGWHGDVRPENLFVGPLVESSKPGADGKPLRRPGPGSFARLAELGLVPIRPNAASLAEATALPYLPPERLDAPAYSPRGDLYGLGATLFYLLTGQPPFPGATADEIVHRVRSAGVPPLEALRPDLPPLLVTLVKQLLAKDPHARPGSASEVETRLAPFGRPTPPAAAPGLVAIPTPSSVLASGAGNPSPTNAAFGAADDWAPAAGGSFTSGHSGAFSTSDAAEAPVRRRTTTAADRARTRMWFLVGGALQVIAILGWCYLMGCFDSSPQANPPANTPASPSTNVPNDESKPKKTPARKAKPKAEKDDLDF